MTHRAFGGLRRSGRRSPTCLALAAAATAGALRAGATDIRGVLPAALDQPRISAIVRYPAASSDPLFADFGDNRTFNITAFLDTGASGVLLSPNTTSGLGIPNVPGVKFYDVGVGGEQAFDVSMPIHISIANSTTVVDEHILAQEDEFNNRPTPSFQGIDLSVYKQNYGPIRAQLGVGTETDPNDPNANPLLDDLDVIGMPAMKGKVVVMDPRPVDTIFTGQADIGFLMKTYVYNPGTAAKPQTANDDPGIVNTTRTIRLSYGSFDEFTRMDPPGAQGPTLDHNPFLGPNPVSPAGDSTPPVRLTFGGAATTGSLLLDTGAAASVISHAKAAALGVTVDDSDPAHPVLVGVPEDQQFTLTISGVGGSKTVAGFYLSTMVLQTQEGSANPNDPKNFRFVEAPVLVHDISVKRPGFADDDPNGVLTLDGILGMNFLVASTHIETIDLGGIQFPFPAVLAPGAFDWVVFDEPNGLLKLKPRLLGDANRDGIVDFGDLVALAQNYNSEEEGLTSATGDFNADGVVDFNDLVVLAQHYNTSDLLTGDVIDLPPSFFDFGLGAGAASGVPEPASAGLAVAGAVLSLARRRRRSA